MRKACAIYHSGASVSLYRSTSEMAEGTLPGERARFQVTLVVDGLTVRWVTRTLNNAATSVQIRSKNRQPVSSKIEKKKKKRQLVWPKLEEPTLFPGNQAINAAFARGGVSRNQFRGDVSLTR